MKKIYKIVFLLITYYLSPVTYSFSQEIEWQKTTGNAWAENLMSSEQTTDGGYICGGYLNAPGDDNYWFVKTDSSGNVKWQHSIGGNMPDYMYCIRQTADGGYILGGDSYSDSSGDKTEDNWDPTWMTTDYWIVKTDSAGNIQWENTIGGTNDDRLNSIQQTTDGGYILGGSSNSPASGDKTESGMGDVDYWIVKTDSLGNILWQNTIGGNWADHLRSIEQTNDGGYILGGSSYSGISGDKTESCIGGNDYWIVKIDASGNILWQNTIGGNDDDYLSGMQLTIDGGYILGGYSYSGISGDKTENSFGDYDYWIVKTDSLGNIEWENTIGGNNIDYLYSVQQTADGGYILGGSSNSSISGDKSENSIGDGDYWVVKTDSLGNIQWQNDIGGSSFDDLRSVRQSADGGYILGGSSLSQISGDKTQNSYYIDFWIVKLTDKYNSITGKLFIDANSNNVQDAAEPVVTDKKVTEINTGRFAYSDPNGNYNVSVLDSGNFAVDPVAISYYNSAPVSHNSYFTGIHQTDSLNDFAFQPSGIFNDLCVTITPLGDFQIGFNAEYNIAYENTGTTTLNPTVIFFVDTNVTFVSSVPVASSITVDSVVWNLGPLAPFQTGSILVTVHVNAGIPLDSRINSWARIEPVAGDANPGCNTAYWEVSTLGSYDPNDIMVNIDTLYSNQFPNPPYLEYIIRFQNTGNDTAINVKVRNPIKMAKLRYNTFEFVASSHPVSMCWTPWERNMVFEFDNIQLPDSNVNESASHGFIRYRIKPNSALAEGDSILNTAYIYFDFNAPVPTNTAVTKIVLPTSIFNIQQSIFNINISPNPLTTQSKLTFKNTNKEKFLFTLYDITGRVTESVNTTNNEIILTKCSKPAGVYLFNLVNEKTGERWNGKIVVSD